MIKIYRKIFILVLQKKSKLFHVIPYRHTYFRIFKNSLFFVKRQNDWMPFLKVYFKYLYFVVWNTTWLVRNKKIHFNIKNFTFKSSVHHNFQRFYCFITRQCITLPICFKAKQLWFQIKFLTKEKLPERHQTVFVVVWTAFLNW